MQLQQAVTQIFTLHCDLNMQKSNDDDGSMLGNERLRYEHDFGLRSANRHRPGMVSAMSQKLS